jgi:hypothetical protein
MLPSIGLRFEEYSGRVSGRAYVGRKQYFEGQQPVFHGGELFFTMKPQFFENLSHIFCLPLKEREI